MTVKEIKYMHVQHDSSGAHARAHTHTPRCLQGLFLGSGTGDFCFAMDTFLLLNSNML